jgi:hypothetical protein
VGKEPSSSTFVVPQSLQVSRSAELNPESDDLVEQAQSTFSQGLLAHKQAIIPAQSGVVMRIGRGLPDCL